MFLMVIKLNPASKIKKKHTIQCALTIFSVISYQFPLHALQIP